MTDLRKFQFILASLLTVCTVVLLPAKVKADETQVLRNQVQVLQQKVDRLQNQLANQNGEFIIQPLGVGFYDQWDPFEQMGAMDRQMSQIMKNNIVNFNPREDIKQTPDAYIVSIDIPGMDKDKINLELKNDMLIISGDRNSEVKENRPNQYYLQERTFGRFLRTMPLPQDARRDNIEAHYKNGVLTVRILRNKAAAPVAEAEKIKVMQ